MIPSFMTTGVIGRWGLGFDTEEQERFPNLQKLTFEDRAMAYEGTMDEFRKRMPMLTEIDDNWVTEVVTDTHRLRPWLDRPWSGSLWR